MATLLFLLAGLLALAIGGDLVVRGAVGLAKRLRVSPLVIGILIVGFGTSLPELVTSVQGALAGSPGVAAGNVVGSNIANVLLILGLGALIHPVVVDRSAFRRDGAALAAATILGLGVAIYGTVDRVIGMALVFALVVYLTLVLSADREDAPSDADERAPSFIGRDVIFVVAGLLATVLGAQWLVGSAIELASALGVSEAVIGLSVVAVGTSLPELAATLAAARRGRADVAFGNIVGSNIFNVLFVLGVTGLIRPIAVPSTIAQVDVWVMAGASAALIGVAFALGRFSRWWGAAFLGAYAIYIAWMASADLVTGAAV